MSDATHESAVTMAPLFPGGKLPLLVQPAPGNKVDLCAWVAANRGPIEQRLMDHGGILFRNFGLDGPGHLESFITAFSGDPLPYRERSSPRTKISGNVYTSTEHPATQHIFLHNENSYQGTWPLKIFFLCVVPPEQGGETPIADCRRILRRIDPQIRERFREKGFRIVRNFSGLMGLPWETVFQTRDRAEVETYCREHGIQSEWKADGGLRTTTLRPALAVHPKTGGETWFNHGTFFHVTTLDPELSEVLTACMPEEDLPTNTYYGDGSAIEKEVLEALRDAYRRETVSFPWQQGDLMVLDNMLTAHGRAPFKGKRTIAVGMSEPISSHGGAEAGLG